MAYDFKAQELAFSLFARGLSKEKALRIMRKEYPGISGATWDDWASKLRWKDRRAALDMKSRDFDELCRDTARVLMLELNEIRQKLVTLIRDGKIDTQTVYAYTSTAKQIADLAKQHMATQEPATVAIAVLQAAIEKLLSELRALPGLQAPLEANAKAVGQIVTQIGEEFGREAVK